MKDSLRAKLELSAKRRAELTERLSQPDVLNDQNLYRDLSREYAELGPVTEDYAKYVQAEQAMASTRALLDDKEMRELASEELRCLEAELEELNEAIYIKLLPVDPDDERNVYLEIRAGTGGDEAAIFAGDLYRMYFRYCERHRLNMEIISCNEGQHGGYKEVITSIEGKGVYGVLKFESGAHRVQRVPATETQGRIHTSACTVVVMPEPREEEEITIAKEDLRIDTFRSSGAGGQHVNTTDSAIRITHLPTGLVVECQDERSQHKNKARAMALLQARIKDAQQREQQQAQAQTRKLLVGSGDRSERIRTYNFPQGRMTDHRIHLTLYSLEQIMQGDLDQLLDGLAKEHIADQMSLVAEEV